MSRHATAEVLSAYLDQELDGHEATALEQHLSACGECRQRLGALRRVVVELRRLERAAPAPALGHLLQRRVALEERPKSLLEKLENRLVRLQGIEPSVVIGFALVFAFAAILYFFAQGVERHQQRGASVMVVPEDGESQVSGAEVAPATTRVLGGRTFDYRDGVWRQRALPEGRKPAKVELASSRGQEIVERESWLVELLNEGEGVVLLIDGQVVEIRKAVRQWDSEPVRQ